MAPWNIVYLHTHDSGRYWSPCGHALPTPRIQAFARESTLFRQCYSAAPTCLLTDGACVPKPAGARINRQDCEDATLPEWEE